MDFKKNTVNLKLDAVLWTKIWIPKKFYMITRDDDK